jgi:UDP-N-acetylglucosamine 4,6-dehydratase (inverting)
MPRIDDSTILITGGTGSFGYAFTKLLLEEHDPEAVRIYSRGEHAQAEMRSHFDDDERLRFLIGNVRDKERLHRAMNGVELAVHAAALKRVPAAEYNPIEAKGTNIDGAANVIDAAIDNEVEDVMAISTDKAVHPVNLYGATKLVAEKLFIQGNAYAGPRETSFSVVRYGNVFGSKGSVVPLFMKQREEGRLTITHEDMTRFWITLEEGVRFVRDSIQDMHGGEIFVPKIPSLRVMDLADTIAPDAEKEIIGIRPGEKTHETLLTTEEARHAREFEDRFVVEPELDFWDGGHWDHGKPLPEGFEYTSGGNDDWLSRERLEEMIEDLGYEL